MRKRLHNGLVEIGTLHVTPVDEEVLVGLLPACGIRLAHKAVNAYQGSLHVYLEQLLLELPAKQVDDALQQPTLGQADHALAVLSEGESHGRICQRYALEFLCNVGHLRLIGLEELPPGRYVVEKVRHLEISTHRTRAWFLRDKARTMYAHFRPYVVAYGSRNEGNLCHGSYGRQGLATESHGVEGEQVLCLAYLGRCVTLESQSCICVGHSLAIVYDLYGCLACIVHRDIHLGRTCVDGILHELLDHGRRPLHHLACSNLVCHRVRE